jgi:hypothetical protein
MASPPLLHNSAGRYKGMPSRYHPALVKLFSISSGDTVRLFPKVPAKSLRTRPRMASTSHAS